MILVKPEKKALSVLLLKRSAILLFIWLCSLLFLYILGSMQGFLETNLSLLITFISFSAPLLGGISFTGLLADLFLMLYMRNISWLAGIMAYSFLLVFSVLMTLLGSGLLLLTGGM